MDLVIGVEEILRLIERAEGYELGSLWVDRGSVYCRNDEGRLRCVCEIGEDRWLQYRAEELAFRVLAEAKGSPLQLPLRRRGRGGWRGRA